MSDIIITNESGALNQKNNIAMKFSFQGSTLELCLLILKNVILTIVSLGIYFPWAKTAMRNYLWSNTQLGKHTFQYTGTGKELFFGYLKVFGLYVIYLGASFAVKDNLFAATMLGFVLIAAVIMLSPFAMWGVHAYRATRSKYRNIAFQIDRSRRKEFIGGIIYRSILCVVTLYLYVPFFFHYVNKYLIESTSFGDLKLRYTGDGTEYFQLIMRNILFCILTLGLYIPWAIVGNLRYRLNHIEIDGAKIKTTIAGGDVLVIALMQIILVPLTLGLAFPYVQVFALKTFFNNMSLEGSLDFAAIQAGTGNGSNALGDTVADFFDVDVL